MGDRTKVLHNETQDKSDLPPAAGQAHAARLNGVNRFAPRGAGAWAALARSGLLPACKKWRSRRASCWLTLTSFTTRRALVKCGVRNGECGMQNGLAQPMPWLAYPQGGNRKASGGRLVRPTPARRTSGIGNRDQPKHTTCGGRPIWENPTYSAFWSVFGVTCLRLQRLASSVGFRDDGGIGTQEVRGNGLTSFPRAQELCGNSQDLIDIHYQVPKPLEKP